MERLRPVAVVELRDEHGGAVFVFDFGRNIAGSTVLSAAGTTGAVLTVRHAETVMANGSLNINWTVSTRIDIYSFYRVYI